MYGKALEEQDILKINSASESELENIASIAYLNLQQKEKYFCDRMLSGVYEKKALLDAGYKESNIYNIITQTRLKKDICLYVSCKQELQNRELKKINQSNVDMIGDSLRYLHAVLTGKDADGKTIEPDQDKIIAAREILKVLKPDQSQGKNKAFSIKKPENESKTAINKANKSNRNSITIKGFNSDNSADDEE